MAKEVLIIGGGIIGLSTAYYANKAGHQVTVIDKSAMNAGASYVNAGYLTPSHLIPLAAPGVMKQGLKWMFNPSSPLFIKPRLNGDFIKWAWAFNKSCSQANVDRSVKAIRDINVMSRELFSDIKKDEDFSFHLERKGLLMLCQTEQMLEEEVAIAKMANSHGLEADQISLTELKAMEPNCNIEALGAIHYGCDGHTTPAEFMAELKELLPKKGVKFYQEQEVTEITHNNGNIKTVATQNQVFTPDEVILAAGSWSTQLAKQLKIPLLLEAGKGYRINSTRDLGISMPAILCERKVAVTPMNGFTRFAGTMEIAGINHNINTVRVEAIANAAKQYYPDINITQQEKDAAACGLRPVSPDGMAYIGRSKKCDNLVFATGHAMMGWSMGPATGKLVTQIISGDKPSIDIAAFKPDRRF